MKNFNNFHQKKLAEMNLVHATRVKNINIVMDFYKLIKKIINKIIIVMPI